MRIGTYRKRSRRRCGRIKMKRGRRGIGGGRRKGRGEGSEAAGCVVERAAAAETVTGVAEGEEEGRRGGRGAERGIGVIESK